MPHLRKDARVNQNTSAAGYPNQANNYPGQASNGPMDTGRGPAVDPAVRDTTGMSNHTAGAGGGAYQQGMTNLPPHNAQGGISQDPYANTVSHNDVAPVNHFSSGQRSGSGSSTTGKIERVIGTITCNSALKAKGMEKEREAQAVKVQRAEINEAERLEHEAQLRRERAVQHGADPANRVLGGAAQAQEYGGNFGNTNTTGGAQAGGNSMNHGGLM